MFIGEEVERTERGGWGEERRYDAVGYSFLARFKKRKDFYK